MTGLVLSMALMVGHDIGMDRVWGPRRCTVCMISRRTVDAILSDRAFDSPLISWHRRSSWDLRRWRSSPVRFRFLI